MRQILPGLCLLLAACSGAAPTTPSATLAALAAPTLGGSGVSQVLDGTDVPFKGDLEAREAVEGSIHHVVGTGHGTLLGAFTYAADIAVDSETGDGAGSVVWTAANGDQLFATTEGRILVADFRNGRLTLAETQIVTGGTRRFEHASGTVTLERTLDLLTGLTTGAYNGTIAVGR